VVGVARQLHHAHPVDGGGGPVRLHVERALGVGREFHRYTGRESSMLEIGHQTAQVLAVRVAAHRRREPEDVLRGDVAHAERDLAGFSSSPTAWPPPSNSTTP